MRLAINDLGEVITASQLNSGISRSNRYFCTICKSKVVFVAGTGDRIAFFRHFAKIECPLYIGNSNMSDIDKYIKNKHSDFHVQWQSIFPMSCLEYRIETIRADDKEANYADIYLSNEMFDIKDDVGNSLFTKFIPNNLVM